jgi:hypothetical protein
MNNDRKAENNVGGAVGKVSSPLDADVRVAGAVELRRFMGTGDGGLGGGAGDVTSTGRGPLDELSGVDITRSRKGGQKYRAWRMALI